MKRLSCLAVFDEATHAALTKYFPPRKYAAVFLHTFHVWWTISNSMHHFKKMSSQGNHDAFKNVIPEFLGWFASWIAHWTLQKLPKSRKFTSYAQKTASLNHTMQFKTTLNEDLLKENYDFVLTLRFQIDALETRFDLYQQISGASFLVFTK